MQTCSAAGNAFDACVCDCRPTTERVCSRDEKVYGVDSCDQLNPLIESCSATWGCIEDPLVSIATCVDVEFRCSISEHETRCRSDGTLRDVFVAVRCEFRNNGEDNVFLDSWKLNLNSADAAALREAPDWEFGPYFDGSHRLIPGDWHYVGGSGQTSNLYLTRTPSDGDIDILADEITIELGDDGVVGRNIASSSGSLPIQSSWFRCP